MQIFSKDLNESRKSIIITKPLSEIMSDNESLELVVYWQEPDNVTLQLNDPISFCLF